MPEQLKARPHDVWTRRLERVFDRAMELDPRPFNIPRLPTRKPIVDCRTFALLLCSILRARGIPARVRNGFATYFTSANWQDHWICEYWDARAKRWVMEDADAQLHGVPAGRFYTGLRAWEMARRRPDVGMMFAYSKDDRGGYAAQTNAVHDFTALNGWVCVSGDSWDLGSRREEALPEAERSVLDAISRLGDGNDAYAQRVALFESREGLKPGKLIRHFDYLKANQESEISWEE